MRTKWLSTETIYAPDMALCLSERAFYAAVKSRGIKDCGEWILADSSATAHTWLHDGRLVVIVSLHESHAKADPIDVAASLVHESVHAFQQLCKNIGEDSPGKEFQAYAIEKMAARLMREYVRQTK